MRSVVVVLAFLLVSSLGAQPLIVGSHVVNPTVVTTGPGAPFTWVNLAQYVTDSSGTVNRATVHWSATCTGAFKIVFLRYNFPALPSFTVVATRGPFNSVAGRNDVTLTPPVSLFSGDLIGVVQLQTFAACGNVLKQYVANPQSFTLRTNSDLSIAGTPGTATGYSSEEVLGIAAYNSDPVLVRVLPAAGSVQGAGAFFKTSLQLLNPSRTAITGNLVFHQQGQPASASDPSLAFTLPSSAALSYSDVIGAMGTSGLGSLDIMTNGGAPVAIARVFSDAGSAGTSGFTEDGLSPNDALSIFTQGFLVIPADLTNFRMNVGVRTLDNGATITITMRNAAGVFRSERTNTYPPNYFEQVTVSQFTGASTIEPGGYITVDVANPGSAFIYGTVIDGRTSDSSFRMADVR